MAYKKGYKKFYSKGKKSYASKSMGQRSGTSSAPRVKVGRGFYGDSTRSTAEKKFVDTTVTGDCSTTGSVTALNLVDEGTGVSQRVGRKICMKSVQLRGQIRPEDALTTGANCTIPTHVRVMIIWDKQVNGVIATIAEILSAATSQSFMNLNNRERFVVLMDKAMLVGPQIMDTTATQSVAAVGVAGRIINKYKKFPQSTFTIFDGTGAGIADINTGGLYAVCIGDRAAGAAAIGNLVARIRYTDA